MKTIYDREREMMEEAKTRVFARDESLYIVRTLPDLVELATSIVVEEARYSAARVARKLSPTPVRSHEEVLVILVSGAIRAGEVTVSEARTVLPPAGMKAVSIDLREELEALPKKSQVSEETKTRLCGYMEKALKELQED